MPKPLHASPPLPEPVYRALGLRMEAIRLTLGLTQREIADRVGLSRASITNIEAGKQRILLDDVPRLAKALGTSPEHLLKGVFLNHDKHRPAATPQKYGSGGRGKIRAGA